MPLKLRLLMQVNSDGMYRYAASEWFNRALAALACSGVRGVAIDVWVSYRSGLRAIFFAALAWHLHGMHSMWQRCWIIA